VIKTRLTIKRKEEYKRREIIYMLSEASRLKAGQISLAGQVSLTGQISLAFP
jgi:hypothetical protein